ncbi:hypothetical protein [Agromyces humi]|uniref:hypothetical protein n=1 Tax=Agromyces humi TaxID=1766800 RepID=UPI00135BC981|nr:hypothetical protein [Agromyces humi]
MMVGSGTGKDRAGSTLGSFARRLPITLALSWWAFAYLLWLVGWPIRYPTTNALQVTLLVVACGAAAVLGFSAVRWARGQAVSPTVTSAIRDDRLPLPVVIGVVGALALVPVTVSTYSGFGLAELGDALSDQAAAFDQASQRILEGSASRSGLLLLQAALAPFTLSAIPYLALAWFERRRHGLVLLLALAPPIVISIAVGRDQQLGWSMVLVGASWVLSRVRRRMPLRVGGVIALALAAAIAMTIFVSRKFARFAGAIICPPGAETCLGGSANGGSDVESGLAVLSSYASQGFEGLGRALNAQWQFGGGLSHAPALQAQISALFGWPLPTTVSSQLNELGWSDSWYWSTGMTGIANDVPWVLIPLVFLVQGALLAATWRRALLAPDWLTVAVFTYTWLGLLFTPQNLQLTVSGPSYVGYLVLVTCYLIRGALDSTRTQSRTLVGVTRPPTPARRRGSAAAERA